MTTWVIESNVFDEDCFNDMLDYLKYTDTPYHVVRVVPFLHEIDGITPDIVGPVVIYGSIGIQKIAAANGWSPGVWSSESFNEDTLVRELGTDYLNHDLIKCKFKDVLREVNRSIFFIKPNTDTKEFAGTTMTQDEFTDWYLTLLEMGYIDDSILEKEVAISSPKIIGCEWRLVVVDGKVSAYSLYKQYQRVMPKRECPEEVLNFAQSIISKYEPAPVYVMDICETQDGFKIIEYNTFNSAGLYKADVWAIMSDINHYIQRAYR